jgi:hypothetical protein
MNDTEGAVVCRRVPFTYHSLLYKLDNIHLKQTYRGKPFGRSTLRKVQRLDNIGFDNTCTYNKDGKFGGPSSSTLWSRSAAGSKSSALDSPVVSAVINKLVPLLVIPEASMDDVSVQG